MTYTNQPVVNVYALTPADEAYQDALVAEREAYGDTYAYDGEDSRLLPADLVRKPDATAFRLLGEHDWMVISGQND